MTTPDQTGRDRAEAVVTARQLAILRGLASGLTVTQIAARIGRDPETVHRRMRRLRLALGAATNAQALDRAWRLGLLTADMPPLAHEQPMPRRARIGGRRAGAALAAIEEVSDADA